MKAYYCEKYNAICLKDECAEGIEVKDPKWEPVYLVKWVRND